MTGMPDMVRLSETEFRLFRDLIYEHCGIYLPDNLQFLLERRLRPRLKVMGHDGFRRYYRQVKYARDGYAELCEIVERITTNETFFFREEYQLRDFVESVIPTLLVDREPEEHIKIWSAGCSSGEEPYTLAMILRDSGYTNQFDFEITGNDISNQVLDKARLGLYREASFREMPLDVRQRYFRPDGTRYRISDDIRDRVIFEQANLMDSSSLFGFYQLDVIFCRNVMIYFSPSSRRALLKTFLEKLRPGGYLLLGHSENLVNVSTGFELVPLRRGIVYRRPLEVLRG